MTWHMDKGGSNPSISKIKVRPPAPSPIRSRMGEQMTGLLPPPSSEKFADNFVNFRQHQTSRLAALEAALVRQSKINECLFGLIIASLIDPTQRDKALEMYERALKG